jgi:hypothetical protein
MNVCTSKHIMIEYDTVPDRMFMVSSSHCCWCVVYWICTRPYLVIVALLKLLVVDRTVHVSY